MQFLHKVRGISMDLDCIIRLHLLLEVFIVVVVVVGVLACVIVSVF